MSRSASSSPLRKKPRLSSPTYDAHFAELDSLDFEALDDIETRHSQEVAPEPLLRVPQHVILDAKEKRRRAIEKALLATEFDDHDDSGISLVDVDAHSSAFTSTASLPIVAGVPVPVSHSVPDFSSATFLPVSLMVSPLDLSSHVPRSSSPENPREPDHDTWFAAADTSMQTTFASASTLQSSEETSNTLGFKTPVLNIAALTSLRGRAGSTWASPSAAALEKAKEKLKVWESEIESELATVEHVQQPVSDVNTASKQTNISREPLKGVGNALSSAVVSGPTPTNHEAHSIAPPPRPFRPPAFTTPRPDNSTTPSRLSRPLIANPVVARSSAAIRTSLPGAPLIPTSHTSPVTPVRPSSSSARIPPQPSTSSTPFAIPRPSGPSQHQGSTPQRARPLGLTPRAQAFTGSRARPKFVTPFKQGIRPCDMSNDAPLTKSQPKAQVRPQSEGNGKVREEAPSLMAKGSSRTADLNENLPKPSNRVALVESGLVPQSYGHEALNEMGFDTRLFSLTTVSHFLYYRFNHSDAEDLSTQMSLGPDSALKALLAMDCRLASKQWVDNHWSLILWKMIGMACLEPATLEKRWCWNEVMRQLHYRYKRELADGLRPALRLITTQDAPPSGPLVLCVSDIFWTEEHVDADGRLVLPHPEFELTDGWYRLRATVDEALARATRNKVLKVGRKIACSGARLELSKKDPMEVLDAYGSAHLVLSGNSTHLAPWHAKLGFQSAPFVATLGSLTSDGGAIPLMDLIIMQIFPVGFIETITTENGEMIREGPRTEKDDALEEDRWKARRSHEAAKLQDELEKKLHRLESYADRLERLAGGGFRSTDDESPPDNIEDLIEELEDSEDPASIIKNITKEDAGWLSLSLRRKCETDREKGGEEIDRELTTSFPPRQVRNFRVLRVKDARTMRKPSWRTAQLTVWDVMSLSITEGGSAGSFNVGQRYMISNLVPNQRSAWMGLEPGSEVYLSTRRDSKWRRIN